MTCSPRFLFFATFLLLTPFFIWAMHVQVPSRQEHRGIISISKEWNPSFLFAWVCLKHMERWDSARHLYTKLVLSREEDSTVHMVHKTRTSSHLSVYLTRLDSADINNYYFGMLVTNIDFRNITTRLELTGFKLKIESSHKSLTWPLLMLFRPVRQQSFLDSVPYILVIPSWPGEGIRGKKEKKRKGTPDSEDNRHWSLKIAENRLNRQKFHLHHPIRKIFFSEIDWVGDKKLA